MTISELKGNANYYEHHTASRRGYISRRSEGRVEAYSGKFGNGYIVVEPRWDTTRFVDVTYYIAK